MPHNCFTKVRNSGHNVLQFVSDIGSFATSVLQTENPELEIQGRRKVKMFLGGKKKK
jgi:hypothetical protein